jgi:hypothetical protein
VAALAAPLPLIAALSPAEQAQLRDLFQKMLDSR